MYKIFGIIMTGLLLSACSLTGNPVKPESTNQNKTALETILSPTPEASISAKPSVTLTLGVTKGAQKIMTEAVITTSKGAITIKLYPESAPLTVNNFVAKAKSDYYKNLTFHRVEDWVVQGGDPEGTGRGGGDMATELSQVPFKIGSVGVARGQDIKISNDSQFFICTQDCSWLTGQYTNFGEVTAGMDVVNKIAIGDKILSVQVK